MIVRPPLSDGAVYETFADAALTTAAVPIVGAAGTVTGVIAVLAQLAVDAPAPLFATTVNVYVVPLVNPKTVIGLDDPDALPPGDPVTV